MKRLEDLPEIAARQLGGLNATTTLLAKVKLNAAEKKQPKARFRVLKPVLAVCAALVLCVGATLVAVQNPPHTEVVPQATENVLDSYAAGEGSVPTEAPRHAADVPVGSLTMSVGGQSSAQTLFAEGNGSSFPLITMNGATYRMLLSPNGISSDLLGSEVGSVSEFNLEPALGSGGVVSNVVERGQSVYAVKNLGSALVAANVEGAMRVFQRVSYAGTAIIGSETLKDTLCAASDVEWLELEGVGKVENADDVKALMNTLLSDSDYTGTSMSGSTSLTIGLTNGITLQLLAGDDAVSACGTWSCPDFFEAFHEAVGR